MTNQPMIDIADLSVRYVNLDAVAGLSLSVGRGEIFGLLGPNGAGKTTTLACIEGLRRPTAGSVRVAGYDVQRDAVVVKRLLGVQLQTTALFTQLRATELIKLYAALYNVFMSKRERIALLDRFGLAPKANARPDQLSGGQLQRLTLALAVVNDPQVVLLDEPTTGLDPQARRGVWALIRRMQTEGRTVLLTTHSMEEAQQLCDRVGIVDAGRLVALGSPHDLIARHAPPLLPDEAARRQPNLEDVFLALTGRGLVERAAVGEDGTWLDQVA
jgi:ABC-2 type transport system ATP-binding protein